MKPAKETKLQKYSAPALEKGLDILEYLSDTTDMPTLSQLAQGIGRSKNEIFRMMIVLEERGYIQRLDGEIFALTEKLALIGGARSDTAKLASLAQPYLEQLSDETSLSSHLAILDGAQLRTIASTEATSSYGLSVRVGYTHPAYGTAAGACFVAGGRQLPDAQDLIGTARLDNTDEAARSFAALVERCKSNTFVEAPNPENNAICEVATPLRQQIDGLTIAAIAVPFIKTTENTNRQSAVVDGLLAITRSLQDKISLTLPGKLQLG